MLKHFFLYISLLCAIVANAAGLTFESIQSKVITETPPASTGLNAIYVLPHAVGHRACYRASSPSATVRWYRYSNLGGAYAQEITDVKRDGATTSIALDNDDMGYIIEEGSQRYYYWIVNYTNHPLSLDELTVVESDCDAVGLHLTGTAGRIVYYSINGRSFDLDRGMTLTYKTLAYNEDTEAYDEVPHSENLPYVSGTIHTRAPLCNTVFTLEGDRFAKEWREDQSVSTLTFNASAIEATTTATQEKREIDNEKTDGSDDSSLGGSAPVNITFHAAVTDAVVHKEWQMSSYPDFDVVDLSFQQLDVDYSFTTQGTTYVRFIAADASGNCEYIGQVYQVFVGESRLECPNAFSPGASEGVNDEWKVSYRSIIDFECHIFNRWGTEMCSFTDPSLGWDGKYRGKLVPAGVYYYVIRATGSDGKEYKLSGDINIINFRRGSSLPAGGEPVVE